MNSPLSDFVEQQNADDEGANFDPDLMLEQILGDPDLLQHLVRTRRDGVETICSYHRCCFVSGQQRHILHVPFSPPFPEVPNVEALAVERSDIRIRITDQQKFGLRAEIILPIADQTESAVMIEIVATCGLPTS